MSTTTLEEAVERALIGGCTLVQLREKSVSSRAFLQTAKNIKAVTDRFGVPLIVNDRLDIALAVDAAGVHLGQDDLPPEEARRILGPNRIVGISAGTVAEALAAVRGGADYIGVGAMFPTGTKTDADIATLDELRRIRAAVDIPIVVIGGVNAERLHLFEGTGIDGLAVVSAVIAQKDIEGAAADLKAAFLQMKAHEK